MNDQLGIIGDQIEIASTQIEITNGRRIITMDRATIRNNITEKNYQTEVKSNRIHMNRNH